MHHVALVMLDYAPPTDSTIWLNEYLGFNNLTVAILTLFILTAFIVRKFTMWFIPILLRKIITSDTIEENAVRDSDKALGTAAGIGFSYLLFDDLKTSMGQSDSNILSLYLTPIRIVMIIIDYNVCVL